MTIKVTEIKPGTVIKVWIGGRLEDVRVRDASKSGLHGGVMVMGSPVASMGSSWAAVFPSDQEVRVA